MIDRVDLGSAHFLRQLRKLDSGVLAEVCERIALLPRQVQLPAKLHAHQAVGQMVPSAISGTVSVPVWTMHATNNDALKASFTLEGGVAYFRRLASHAEIDRNP